jgi:hypothetical protein
MKRPFGRYFLLSIVALLSAALAGCLLGVRTGDVMVRPEVGEYERLALVGLEAPAEELFRSMFRETFPGVEFADRNAVLDLYPEEEVRLGGVGEEIRSRMRSSLGVQGIMVLTWDDSGMGGTLDWVLEITDAETGATTGTAVAHVRKEPMARGVEFEELERRAFEALISTLEERLNRS